MTQRQWPAETKQRAEKVMADLEAFYDTIRNCTPFGRRQEMTRFSSLRFAIVGVSGSDSYITQKLTTRVRHLQPDSRPRALAWVI